MKATGRRRRRSGRSRPPIRLGRGILAAVALVVIVAALIVSRSIGRSQPTSTGPALTTPTALGPAGQPLAVGTAAPDVDLASVDGQHVRLSPLRGHRGDDGTIGEDIIAGVPLDGSYSLRSTRALARNLHANS